MGIRRRFSVVLSGLLTGSLLPLVPAAVAAEAPVDSPHVTEEVSAAEDQPPLPVEWVQAAETGEPVAVQTRSYSYDPNTNRTAKTVTDATGSTIRSESYSYHATDRLESRTIDGVASSYTYDAAGNLTSGDGRSYTWTATNRIEQIDTTINIMGVRLYQPDLGRFLSIDPVYGGSVNGPSAMNEGAAGLL